VNNGTAAPTRTKETENRPNELLEAGNAQRLDTRAEGAAGGSNQPVEAVAAIDRS
jgi:hypothetical protein